MSTKTNITDLTSWLIKNQFQSTEIVRNKLVESNLKVSEIHDIYCLFNATKRSLLRGSKQQMLHLLLQNVMALSYHKTIANIDEDWHDLTPEQKFERVYGDLDKQMKNGTIIL